MQAPIASASDSNGGGGHDGVFAQDAASEADVADERVEPRQQPDVTAALASGQAVAKTPPRVLRRCIRRHALGDQPAGLLFQMKSQLVFQIVIEATAPKHVGEAGQPWTSRVLQHMADRGRDARHRLSSTWSWRRPVDGDLILAGPAAAHR